MPIQGLKCGALKSPSDREWLERLKARAEKEKQYIVEPEE
jgi:hypothetical protein